MSVVKFLPTIELGHVLQAAVAAATLTGWALWGYATIEAQIQSLHTEVSLQQLRVDEDEKLGAQERDDARARDVKVSAALDKISDQVSDLRTLVARKEDGPSHR